MKRVRFNSGSFFAGSWGLVAITAALAKHFHRDPPFWGLMVIGVAGGFVLAFEPPARAKPQPRGHANERIGPPPAPPVD